MDSVLSTYNKQLIALKNALNKGELDLDFVDGELKVIDSNLRIYAFSNNAFGNDYRIVRKLYREVRGELFDLKSYSQLEQSLEGIITGITMNTGTNKTPMLLCNAFLFIDNEMSGILHSIKEMLSSGGLCKCVIDKLKSFIPEILGIEKDFLEQYSFAKWTKDTGMSREAWKALKFGDFLLEYNEICVGLNIPHPSEDCSLVLDTLNAELKMRKRFEALA